MKLVKARYSITSQSQPGRAFDTVYQNTTGKPLFVAAQAQQPVGDSKCLSDSSNPPTTIVARSTGGIGGILTMTFVVLPGNYYKFTTDGGGTLGTVTEWY